jgi:hypothetical protein
MNKSRIALVLCLISAGCATVTEAPSLAVEKSRITENSFDVVWGRLVSYFASNQISIQTIEKDSGLIVAGREVNAGSPGAVNVERINAKGAIGDMAECGQNTGLLPYGYTIRLNVLANKEGDKTRVTVNTQFRELRSTMALFGAGPQTSAVDCSSTGRIEKTILDIVSAQ